MFDHTCPNCTYPNCEHVIFIVIPEQRWTCSASYILKYQPPSSPIVTSKSSSITCASKVIPNGSRVFCEKKDKESEGDNTSLIIAIVCGVIALVLLVIVVIVYLKCYRTRDDNIEEGPRVVTRPLSTEQTSGMNKKGSIERTSKPSEEDNSVSGRSTKEGGSKEKGGSQEKRGGSKEKGGSKERRGSQEKRGSKEERGGSREKRGSVEGRGSQERRGGSQERRGGSKESSKETRK
ncbi:hypothetical protein PFISCL1PPCAC_16108 [Pristionchus fissidentatus]|uniref:Uncharacterized protein n=1 Tax=Pristionchus fissidentatus TaxID=1538716 RepID=A0AAV5VY98_9BILA|nr:hypothetical protein PFISCL1PPCAC_16108 [Pristionchus fissidentatus]